LGITLSTTLIMATPPTGRIPAGTEVRVIRKYVECGLRKARYEKREDGSFVARVPGLRGVLASAASRRMCRVVLEEVIESWVISRGLRGLKIPVLDGIRVDFQKPRTDLERMLLEGLVGPSIEMTPAEWTRLREEAMTGVRRIRRQGPTPRRRPRASPPTPSPPAPRRT
jgi:predicted RNase H-like HicB family nuclease